MQIIGQAQPGGGQTRPGPCSKVGASLTVELLDRVRQDITSSRLLEYNLTEQVMKVVQDVSMRQTEQGMTVGTSKVFWYLGDSVSNGRTSLDPLNWEESKKMEKERKERA